MRIHADDCPALCRDRPVLGFTRCKDGHTADHSCECTAQADLAELVAAAELSFMDHGSDPSCHSSQRLDAALKPFREEKPK